MLPAEASIALVLGDAGLASALRSAGVAHVSETLADLGGERADAILLSAQQGAAFDRGSLIGLLAPRGIVAVPVGGEGPSAPRGGRMVEALRLATGALPRWLATGRWSRWLRAGGLQTRAVATGPRTRAHRLWIGGPRPLAPAGVVVVGSRGDRGESLLERAIAEATAALNTNIRIRRATVRGSGVVLVDGVGEDGESYMMRIGTGASGRLLERSLVNLRAVSQGAPDSIRGRLALPLVERSLGETRLVVEPKIRGAPPRRLGARLWTDCIEFLVSLRSLPAAAVPAAPGLARDADALAPHLPQHERTTLGSVVRALSEELGEVSGGWAHGDFWAQNVLASRGRLVAVIDWDAARPDALPLLDLLHLIATGEPRLRRLSLGRRCTSALWPLAGSGGDERILAYCEATATPSDPRTLTALATAYWLTRVGREMRTFADRPSRRRWMSENVHHPLAVLGGRR